MELVGKEVEACGLVGQAVLNGQRGTVLTFVKDKGRCAVRFGDSSVGVLIKPSNLRLQDAVPPPALDIADQHVSTPPAIEEGEERLIAALQKLKLEKPQATAKELHTALVAAGNWSDLSLSKVKKAAPKASKRAARMPDPQSTKKLEKPTTAEHRALCEENARLLTAASYVTTDQMRSSRVMLERMSATRQIQMFGRQIEPLGTPWIQEILKYVASLPPSSLLGI